jgi:selenocysteine lyase/cysteine desulfurase
LSVRAAEIIYDTREAIGEFFNFPDLENIVLTKNATEALNIAIHGSLKRGAEVVTTSMEHNSVMRPLNYLKSKGTVRLKILKADKNGVVSPDQINKAITDMTKLVVVTSASNVTGTKMDLEGIYKVCKAGNVKLLVDGAQGAGAAESCRRAEWQSRCRRTPRPSPATQDVSNSRWHKSDRLTG